MELKNIRGKYNAKEADKYIESVIKDYEKLASQQRERMMELRNENSKLKKASAELENKKAMLVSALVSAQRTSNEVIERANTEAKEITQKAREQEKELLQRIEQHTQMFFDLRKRCQNILTSIDGELARWEEPRPRIYGVESYPKAK